MNTIKTVITQIVKPLNHVCNVSFETGVFLNNMKIVLPILRLVLMVHFQFVDLSLCYHKSRKSWKNYTMIGQSMSVWL